MNIRPANAAYIPTSRSTTVKAGSPSATGSTQRATDDSVTLSSAAQQPPATEFTKQESRQILASAGICAGLGAMAGAIPVAGLIVNLGYGMLEGGKDDVLLAGGVGALNLGGTFLAMNGHPAAMLVPALAGAALWGYHGLVAGFGEVENQRRLSALA